MLKSIFANWVGVFVIGLISIVITPFMVHRLGDFQFGLYTLAFSVLGYSQFLELGIRNSLQRFVGRLSGMGDRHALNLVFSTSVALTTAIGALIIAISFFVALPLAAFFKQSAANEQVFASLVILLGLNLGLGLPATLLQAYLAGLQRFDIQNLLAIIRQGLRAIFIVVVLLRGHGVIAVGAAILAATLLILPVNWVVIRKIDPNLKFSLGFIHWKTARELLVFSFWTLLNNTGQFLRDSVDSIVIGRVLGTALITPFTVAARMIDYFRPVIIGLVSPLLPRVSELDGQGRHDEVRDIFLRMTRFSALASFSIGSLLILHGRMLLLLWMGERYVSSYPVLVLLTIGAISSLAQFGTLHTLTAMNRHQIYGMWTVGEGVVNVILSVIWAHSYGIAGVALGTAVPLIVVKVTLQPWYVTRVLGMTIPTYFKKALAGPMIACLAFLGVCKLFGGFRLSPSIWHFAWTAALELVLLIVLMFILGLDRSDRKLLRWRFPRVAQFVPAF